MARFKADTDFPSPGTLLVMGACYLLLSRTSFGLRVRATLENPALARASGISTPLIYGATFAFGAALAL